MRDRPSGRTQGATEMFLLRSEESQVVSAVTAAFTQLTDLLTNRGEA